MVDPNPFTATYEVYRGTQTTDTTSFFVNSDEADCPTHHYELKMDSAGTQDLDQTLASIFSIDSLTGLLTYEPSIAGSFSFYVLVFSESGVQASREIQIES